MGGVGIGKGVMNMAAKGGMGMAASVGGEGLVAAKALGAFSLAVVGAALAADQAKKLYDENGGENSDAMKDKRSYEDRMAQMSKEGNYKGIEQMGQKYIAKEKDRGSGVFSSGNEEASEAARTVAAYADAAKNVAVVSRELKAGVDTAMESMDTGKVVEIYNRAVSQHNESAAKYAAGIILAQFKEGGLQEFAQKFQDATADVLAKVRDFAAEGGKDGKGKGDKPPPPVQDFRGSTININQDFRDQDPDRVAIVFRQDLMRAAESRRQGRVGTPFGV